MSYFESSAIMPTTFTAGAPTGAGENLYAAYEYMYRVSSLYGVQDEFYEADQENLRQIEALTGKKPQGASPMQLGQYAEAYETGKTTPLIEVEKTDAEFAELKRQYPQIKTRRELWQRQKEMAQEITANYEDVTRRATTGGWLGGLAGSIMGSFTARDPVQLATLPFGGFGRSLLTRVGTEVLVNAAVDAGNQGLGVYANKKLLGLKPTISEAAFEAAAAGLGAGLLRGGGELAVMGTKALSKADIDEFMQKVLSEKPSVLLEKVRSTMDMRKSKNRMIAEALEREVLFEEITPQAENIVGDTLHYKATDAAERALDGDTKALDELVLPEIPSSRFTEAQLQQAAAIQQQLGNVFTGDVEKKIFKDIGYKPTSLSQFIKNAGGISDDMGEFAARNITAKSLPGLIRKQGVQMDYLKQAAHERGYFPEAQTADDISDSDFIDAITRDVQKDRVYAIDDVAKIQEARSKIITADDFEREGITKGMTLEEIAARLPEVQAMEITRQEALSPDALDALEEHLKWHEGSEADVIAREIADIRPEDVIYMEDANGNITEALAQDLFDDLALDDFAINAVRTCWL